MPLKLIGAGYGRTGTMSTFTALNQLGLPCYHMIEVLRNPANPTHLEFWRQVGRDRQAPRDWEQVFANYAAAVDFPVSCVWRELMAAYPDAKVLLTLHPKGADAWFDSAMETIYMNDRWYSKVLGIATSKGRRMGEMTDKLVWKGMLKGAMPDRAAATAEYQRHIDEVIATVPPEKLLVFTANQGWEPLCAFLGLPVPEKPFPNVNDRAQFQKMFRGMKIAAGGIVAAAAIVVGGLGFALGRLG
jgi:hypothetical protein